MHRDHHIEVAKALYSIPGDLIGARVEVRADSPAGAGLLPGPADQVPSPPGTGRAVTDPDDLPAEQDRLRHARPRPPAPPGRRARTAPSAPTPTALLDTPLPWTKMRQVYALLGLVKRWGPDRVEAACAQALEAEAFNVGLDRPA